jgi:hypothetical protein
MATAPGRVFKIASVSLPRCPLSVVSIRFAIPISGGKDPKISIKIFSASSRDRRRVSQLITSASPSPGGEGGLPERRII